MACRVVLINPKNNKEVKEEFWNDIYSICETKVKELNDKLTSKGNEKFWKITHINI
jgi:hypothetical protein